MVIVIAAWVGTDLLSSAKPRYLQGNCAPVLRCLSTGGTDLLDEVVADEFVDHDPMPGQPQGLVGIKLAVDSFRAAFPDGEMVVDELIPRRSRGRQVTMSGTHRGEYAALAGTGRAVRAEGVEVFRLADGKLAEGWSRFVLPLAMIEADRGGQIPADDEVSADIDLEQMGASRDRAGPIPGSLGGSIDRPGRSVAMVINLNGVYGGRGATPVRAETVRRRQAQGAIQAQHPGVIKR